MKRALPLLALGLFSVNAMAEGPALVASIYMPDVEVTDPLGGTNEASPDGLTVDLRVPLNKNFWLGGTFATTLSSDSVSTFAGDVDTELGASVSLNLGIQAEIVHHVSAYAYLGYGAAKVLLSSPSVPVDDIDGNGVAWGVGAQFLLGEHLLVDAGYASLFDDTMEDSSGNEYDTTIAGPRVGLGYQF